MMHAILPDAGLCCALRRHFLHCYASCIVTLAGFSCSLHLMQASVKNIGRAVQRMSSTDLLTELQRPDLLPGLFEAFDHQSADVRKAVTMCLMHMWQVCLRAVSDAASPAGVQLLVQQLANCHCI